MTLMRVPLAWRNLVHDKRRFAVSTAGIALAVLLMFVELGFWNALLDSATQLLRDLNADLVIISRARYAMIVSEPFSVRRLDQARAVPGVRMAFPVFIEEQRALWKNSESYNPDEPYRRNIRVVAFNPQFDALKNPEIKAQRRKLMLPGAVLIDRQSSEDFGKRHRGLIRELADQSVEIVGCFTQGPDFSADGNVVASDRTFAKLFGQSRYPGAVLDMADIGLIQLEEGADRAAILKSLRAMLPMDVQVLTRDDFVAVETRFWQQSTPIGFIFLCGLIMGIIVGMVICSQILSADVTDHLKEYATLKAIGYSNAAVMSVVLQQALLLCLTGFVPALGGAALSYAFLGATTRLPMDLTVGRIAFVFLLSAAMCIVAGLLAVQKVIKADPAEVF
ncbi:MAG: FtsX-like permease family protein [Planctomycetes bacterium]|nr:FtsX-like permease family protein [Planctomycetota bacterium]